MPSKHFSLVFLLTIPLTIVLGMYVLEERRFYVTSLLVILQVMVMFWMGFEGQKPQARRMVLVAVMCALAVAARVAFFMVPQFKPMVAMVVVAGIALGGRAGFLVGAMAALVSNMYFGQGPWTPWQMFALGMVGFLGGVLFRKRRGTAAIAAFGGLATFFIYGGIMNVANVLIFLPYPTAEMFALSFLRGAPFDAVHAVATVIFLAIISRPMLEKLDRV